MGPSYLGLWKSGSRLASLVIAIVLGAQGQDNRSAFGGSCLYSTLNGEHGTALCHVTDMPGTGFNNRWEVVLRGVKLPASPRHADWVSAWVTRQGGNVNATTLWGFVVVEPLDAALRAPQAGLWRDGDAHETRPQYVEVFHRGHDTVLHIEEPWGCFYSGKPSSFWQTDWDAASQAPGVAK